MLSAADCLKRRKEVINQRGLLPLTIKHGLDCLFAVIALVLVTQPMWADDASSENRHRSSKYSGGYGEGFVEPPAHHSRAQIEERSEHCQADIDILWHTAQHLHPGVTTKSQIESTYSDFESLLQKAGDELDTGESKSDWAAELITYYTRPRHKWPAVSPTLDNVLEARGKLVQFTSEQTVKTIEQKLYRFASPEDKSRYYRSPDLRPIPRPGLLNRGR